jgi:hypothetical protein
MVLSGDRTEVLGEKPGWPSATFYHDKSHMD